MRHKESSNILLSNKDNIVVWGTGEVGLRTCIFLYGKQYRVNFFIDKNKKGDRISFSVEEHAILLEIPEVERSQLLQEFDVYTPNEIDWNSEPGVIIIGSTASEVDIYKDFLKYNQTGKWEILTYSQLNEDNYFLIDKFKSAHAVINYYKTDFSKNCLIRYISSPFTEASNKHQNYAQVLILASILHTAGYNIDVEDYWYTTSGYNKTYDLVIDNKPRHDATYLNYLCPDAKVIGYLTGSNPVFQHNQVRQRIKMAEERCNTAFFERVFVKAYSVDDFRRVDSVLMFGNKKNLQTYEGFHFRSHFLLSNSGYSFPWLWDGRKKINNFIYFASAPSILKGLDLLIEAFAREDCRGKLYVCGYYNQELDFWMAYHKTIEKSDNIIPVGFMDISSERFMDIIASCSYTILPTCSEGRAGSVLTMMSAGIIPIVSEWAGFDENEVVLLPDCNIDTLVSTVNEYGKKSENWVKNKADYFYNLAANRFSLECYKVELQSALSDIGVI